MDGAVYTQLGHSHRPGHYQANDFYIVLYKFCIVELLLSQMGCHTTSITCTISHLILQFCDGGLMTVCLDRNI
jgi:hypothetical protein